MKKIMVEIEGTAPLLMHSAINMVEQTATRNPAKQYDFKAEAENVTYRTKEGYLCVPSRCIKSSLLNAASWYKFGKTSAKPILAGCTKLEPYEVPLLDIKGKIVKDYEIDRRPVVIQRQRIIRSRPKITDWKLKFEIIYNEEMIVDVNVIKKIIEEAGQRVGLLDNRPQRYGENGTFKLNKFVVKP